ncbi:MAG: helix-turn-helix domain-containing protein [Muricoprocola sp.]
MAVMTNLEVSQDRVQLLMAEKKMNPYDLCSAADISYATYRRIMKVGNCKIATLGKLASALGVKVTDILEGGE